MDPLIGAALIAGGSGLLSNTLGFFGQPGQSDTAVNDARFMNDFAWKQALRNEQFNNDWVTNNMQIRSRDAALAGLHPLAALGVNISSGPSSAAFVGQPQSEKKRNAYALGADLSDTLGQNISRAMLAQKSAQERALAQATLDKINSETAANNSMARMYDRQNPPSVGTPPSMPTMDENQKYQLLYNPMSKRYEWALSAQASQAIMSDPVRMWSESFSNAFAGPDTRQFWSTVGRSARRLAPWNLRESIRGGN